MDEDSRVPILLGRPFLVTARAMIDVFNKKITLRVGDDEELLANEEPDSFLSRRLEKSIDQSDLECCESANSNEKNGSDSENSIRRVDSTNMSYPVTQGTTNGDDVRSKNLYSASTNEIDEKKPELKNLPQHLEYAYLHGAKSFPIIISSELSEKEKISLLQVLERRKGAITWKISDIKGISLSYCTHKILKEDDYKPVIQPQSSWVSLIHVVPKKGGMTVVLNDNNELIPSRTVIGWRDSFKYQSLQITPKEEHVTLDKPESPNPFLPASQVEFSFDEIYLTTNNEESFTRAPTQYKECLCEFWYTVKTLDDSKIWVSTPTSGIRRDIDVHVDSKAPKPSLQTEEVPQGKKARAKSGLRRKQSSKHTSESKTKASKSKTGQSEKET
ncbi:hypothetical protein Tco_0232638 [Tanacetum coccineum]